MSYVPFFLGNQGKVSADTKAYLYLDPSHLLATATSMWNTDQGYGMVTHQNIGYLFPMGPFFWLTHTLSVPTWIAQRFWMGSLLFLAGLGLRKVAQELGLSLVAAWSAALPYVFTPFILVNIGRTSAILMPWAGLGWLLLFAIRSGRFGGWKNPARFAVVVALVGGVNATSILLVGLAPAIWLIFAVLSREIPWKYVLSAVVRIGLLCTAVSFWWIAGLWAEGKFGINILRYTETIPTVASTSSSSEVFRGLGYWYFYGWDHSQAWTTASVAYTKGQIAPFFSLILPTISVIVALFVRWRYRTFAVVTAFLGVVIAVGAYPYNSPTPVGSVLKWLGENTTVGLAMRSTNRVVPIVVLSLCLLLGSSIDALRSRYPQRVLAAFLTISLTAIVALTPLFKGTILAENLSSPEKLPSYILDAAHDLNAGANTSNVLGLPGLDFGYYRWGTYVDSMWPGILSRPFITSQVTLQGQPASVNLVRSLDGPIQNLIALPQSIAPIARLLGAGDILFQFDTQYERFSGPEPWYLWQLAQSPDTGLVFKKAYGPVLKDKVSDGQFVNESNLALPSNFQWPKSLAVYGVTNARQLVRTEPRDTPAIVAGDGEGLVNLAGLGLLPENRSILYDGALSAEQMARMTASPNTPLFLTDTNQRRHDTFGLLHSSAGYVEHTGEKPVVRNFGQQTLLAFPNSIAGAQTVSILGSIKSIQASSYGNPIANTPEVQPYYAVDGLKATGWQTAAFSKATGEFIEITLNKPLTFDHIHLNQPKKNKKNRWITRVSVLVDGKNLGHFALGKATRLHRGGDIKFGSTTGSVVRIVIDQTSHDRGSLAEQSGVGFLEIHIPGQAPVTHSLQMPTSLLSRAGSAAQTNELHIVMTRARVATTPPRTDPEMTIDRLFQLPSPRTFTIRGTSSISTAMNDRKFFRLIVVPSSAGNAISGAYGSSRIVGSLTNGPWAAFDGDPTTSWMPGFQTGPKTWLEARTKSSQTISHTDITFINDGIHMVPTRLKLTADRGHGGSFTFDTHMQIQHGVERGTTQTLRVNTTRLTGRKFRLTVEGFKAVGVKDRVTGTVNHPPIAITEMQIGSFRHLGLSSTFTTECRRDLLAIDGIGVPIRVTSSTTEAISQRQISFSGCGDGPVTLAAGEHRVQTTIGSKSGLNIDNIALNSSSALPTSEPTPINNLESHWTNRWTIAAEVPKTSAGQYIAVGQSFGPGWTAHLDGVDLGAPQLIDGASMAWLLPEKMNATQHFVATWTPQNTVNLALIASLIGLLLCLFLTFGRAPRTTTWLPDSHPRIESSLFLRRPGVVLTTSVLAALCISWWLVPIAGAVVFYLWVSHRAWRVLTSIVTVLIVAAAGFTIAASRMDLVRSIEWPSQVPFANAFTWIALALWLVLVTASAPTLDAPSLTPEMEESSLAERRRGLNIPIRPQSLTVDERDLLSLVVATRGFQRSLALVRAILVKRRDPDLYHRIILTDSMNQVVGKSPLYNRNVLEISDFATAYSEGLANRGARVTSMRREQPQIGRRYDLSRFQPDSAVKPGAVYTPLSIPSADAAYDLVFATNVFSSVEEPVALLNEMIRVTRPGGSIYIQNETWFSPWGGRETSPKHLISGAYGRQAYYRKYGHYPRSSYGVNFFRLSINKLLRSLHEDPRLVVVSQHPRYLPESFGWLLKVPVLRELVTINLVVHLEKTLD